jgi:hypothetical protein
MGKYDFYSDTDRNHGQKYVILDASDEDEPRLLTYNSGKVIVLDFDKDLEERIDELIKEHGVSYSIVIDIF